MSRQLLSFVAAVFFLSLAASPANAGVCQTKSKRGCSKGKVRTCVAKQISLSKISNPSALKRALKKLKKCRLKAKKARSYIARQKAKKKCQRVIRKLARKLLRRNAKKVCGKRKCGPCR